MRSVRWIPGLLALAIAGCGGAAPPTQAEPDLLPDYRMRHLRQASAMEQSIDELETQLGEELAQEGTLTPEGTPELRCDEACNLCFNICDLRERICWIADEYPENPTLAGQCVDASIRCKRGTRDTEAVCDCEDVEVRIRI